MSLPSQNNHVGIRKYFVGSNELTSQNVVPLNEFEIRTRSGSLKRKILEIDSNSTDDSPQVSSDKRGSYRSYTPALTFKVGSYAAERGVNKAFKKFATEFNGAGIPKTSIRDFRRRVLGKLPVKKRVGRQPALPRTILTELEKMIKGLSGLGAPVRLHTVQTCVRALLVFNKQIDILKNRNFSISPAWCSKWLQSINFTLRKPTKGKMKKTVEQIQQQRRDFVHRIALNIMEHKIPPELVVNLDQTGLHLAPVSNSTFASKGSKQVVVRFSQDKRQVTALLSGSASGVMLPSQIIFKGLTDRSHPDVSVPPGWLLSHSNNHWSNISTMLDWLHKIAVPWRHSQIEKLKLNHDQKGLLIFDCWAVHKLPEWINACNKAGFHVVFIPAGYTDSLQPMDLTVNKCFKSNIRSQFDEYLVGIMAKQLKEETVDTNFTLPQLKSKIVEWSSFSQNKIPSQTIAKGFEMAGIMEAWKLSVQKEAVSRKNLLVTRNTPTVTAKSADDSDGNYSDYDSESDSEDWQDTDALLEEDIEIQDENISTMLSIVEEAEIEEPDTSGNPYAKVYLRRRRDPLTPVKGRSLSKQYEALSKNN